MDIILEESSSRELTIESQLQKQKSNDNNTEYNTGPRWSEDESSKIKSEISKNELNDEYLSGPNSASKSKKIDLYQPLDIIDESCEDLGTHGKKSQQDQDSGELFSGSKSGDLGSKIQSYGSSSGSFNKQASLTKPTNFSNYKIVEVEQAQPLKKVKTFNQGGSTFSQNYSIESASQVQNKVSGQSSFLKSSSFGQGYSFGQQQANAQKQTMVLEVPYSAQKQHQDSSSFNKNYSIAAASDNASQGQPEAPKSQGGGSFASYKFSQAQIDTINVDKGGSVFSVESQGNQSKQYEDLTKTQDEPKEPNTHRGNTIEDKTSQFTYKIASNDISEGGRRRTKENNQSQTFKSQQNDSNNIQGSRRPKKNKIRQSSSYLDGLDLNVIKGFQKPVSYNLNSGLEMSQQVDLSATINPGQFDPMYMPPPPENNLLASTFKGFDEMGDMSSMNVARQQNDILDKSYSNLLAFGSGKDLQKNNVIQRQRLNSVMVGVQDHQAMIKDFKGINSGPPVLPQFKGYGDGVKAKFQKPLEATQQALSEVPQSTSVPFADQMTQDDKKQLMAQMKIQMRVNKSEIYLKKLRSSKSYERPIDTIEQKIKKKDVFFDSMKMIDLQESMNSDITEKEQKTYKQIKGDFRIRLKSENQITFSGLVYYKSLKSSFKLERLISMNELIELRYIIQKMLIGVPNINYYFVILQDTKNLIDFFVDQPLESIMDIKPLKEIIYKFEQLKSDLLRKIYLASQPRDQSGEKDSQVNKSQEIVQGNNVTVGTLDSTLLAHGSPRMDDISANMRSYSLSLSQICNMKHIFNEIRYILTKFGRTINYIDKMQAGYKRYLLKIEMNKAPQGKNPNDPHGSPSNKLAPPIKRIIEQQKRDFLSSTNPGIQTISEPEKPKQNYKTFVAEEKKMNKSRAICLNFNKEKNNNQVFHVIEIMKILNEFPLEERLRIIFNYHKLLNKKWKEEFDNNRVKDMPSILCRICNREFYADQSEKHSKNCIDKNVKIKAQKDLNTEFLILSNRATEVMIQIERINIQTPEFKSISKFGKILQTPSLQRRALGGITMNHFDKGDKQPRPVPANRAFSIQGGSALNRFQSDLIKLPNQLQESKVNPLLAYSLNHQQNCQSVSQQNLPNNPFQQSPGFQSQSSISASKSPIIQPQPQKKIPALNFAKLNTFVKDDVCRKSSSNQLAIITEEKEKLLCKNHSESMVDIGEIRFVSRNAKVKNEICREDTVKYQSGYDKREKMHKIKNQIQTIMEHKENGNSIELKNKSRQVSQRSLMRREEESRSLAKIKINQWQRISNKMLEKIKIKYYVTENIKVDINKFISKNPLLLSRFIKNPQSESQNFDLPKIQLLDSATPQVPIQSSVNSSMRQEQKSNDNTSQSLKLSQKIQIRNELKTVKQEITIMENLKNLTQSCFELSQINHSFRSQISIYKQYQNQINILQQRKEQISLPDMIFQFLINLDDTISRKLTAINELAEIEVEYNKTLPKQEYDKLCKSLMQLDVIFDKLQTQANNMQMLLSNLACYNSDGSSSNTIRIDNKSVYDRRQSMAVPMMGSFVPQNKMLSLHSKILDTTDNSQIYRRGSTAYSQFSLLSELDSEKNTLSKKQFRQPSSSNQSNDTKHVYDRLRQDSIQISNNGFALEEIQEKINQENNDVVSQDNNSVKSPEGRVNDLVEPQKKRTPKQSTDEVTSKVPTSTSEFSSFAKLMSNNGSVRVFKEPEANIFTDTFDPFSQVSDSMNPLVTKKTSSRQNSKQFEKSKFKQYQAKKLDDEQSDANSSSNSVTNQNNKADKNSKYFPTLEEIEEFVPLSKILTYVDNLKLQQGIKPTTPYQTKSSRESNKESVLADSNLGQRKDSLVSDTMENLSMPSDSSGDFSDQEDEFDNTPKSQFIMPHFQKLNTQSMDKITIRTQRSKIQVPVSLSHFQNTHDTKLINLPSETSQKNSLQKQNSNLEWLYASQESKNEFNKKKKLNSSKMISYSKR